MSSKYNFDDPIVLDAYFSRETEDIANYISTIDSEIRNNTSLVFKDPVMVRHIAEFAEESAKRGRASPEIIAILEKNPSKLGALRTSILSSDKDRSELMARSQKLAVFLQTRAEAPGCLALYRNCQQKMTDLHKLMPIYRGEEISKINMLRAEADAARDCVKSEHSRRLNDWSENIASQGRSTSPEKETERPKRPEWWLVPRSQRNADGAPLLSHELPTQQPEQVVNEEAEKRHWASLTPLERQIEQAKMLEQEGPIPDWDDTRGRR